MREVFSNAYEFAQSIFSKPKTVAQKAAEKAKQEQDKFNNEQLAINRTLGVLALRDYQRGDSIYQDLLQDLRYDMIKRGFKIADLELPEEESRQIQELTDLE